MAIKTHTILPSSHRGYADMPSLIARVLFASGLCLILTAVSSAQEWTRFRGPDGSGVSEATTIPVSWTEHDYNWKTQLPGVGHSCPVVWGSKVFLLSANPQDATRYVLCVDTETGKVLWQRDFPSTTHHLHQRSSYASATPAVDEKHVYVAWATPEAITFAAFDHDGHDVWTKNLGSFTSQHGWGASPIVYKDLVILHDSQDENPGESFMLGFDRNTGNEVWRTSLVAKNVCYSVPFIYSPPGGGPDELICTSTGNGIFSLDPLTGEQNWAVGDLFRLRNVSSPIVVNGVVLGASGSGSYSENSVVAVKLGDQPKLAYELKNSDEFKAPYVPCLIGYDGMVFCLYDKGFASCIDAATGKIHWMKRTNAAFSGSPVRVRDKIYIVDEDGVVWVFAASQSYQVLAKNPLGEPSRSTPAVSGGRIYFRTSADVEGHSHLISIGGHDSAAANGK